MWGKKRHPDALLVKMSTLCNLYGEQCGDSLKIHKLNHEPSHPMPGNLIKGN